MHCFLRFFKQRQIFSVNAKWNAAAEFVWKDKLKLEFLDVSDLEIIKHGVEQITLKEVIQIVRKSGHKLKEITLFIDDYCDDKNTKILCYIGKHRYFMTRKFKLKSLIQALSSVSQNIVTLKVRYIDSWDQLIWEKLIQRNKDLASFEFSCKPENLNVLLSLPTSLKRIKLRFPYEYTNEHNEVS